MNTANLEIVFLRNVCIRKNSKELIDRLTKKPINMRGTDSFPIEYLISHRGDDMYIFVDETDYQNTIYIGFCIIYKINNEKVLDQFEIFKEHRNKGYGKIFARKLMLPEHMYDNSPTFDNISQILNHAILFWWKSIPEYFDYIIENLHKNVSDDLQKDEHINVIKKEMDIFIKKYNHDKEFITHKLFNKILQHWVDNYDGEKQTLKNYIESSNFWKKDVLKIFVNKKS